MKKVPKHFTIDERTLKPPPEHPTGVGWGGIELKSS